MTDRQENTEKVPYRIRAGMSQVFEVCMLAQVICAFLAFFMATRSQTASVVLSAIACALAVPMLGIIVLSALAGRDGASEESLGGMESIVETAVAVVISAMCLIAFFPRFGRFAEKNPYSNDETLQCIVEFVVGEQFVVPGSIQSDGLIMKVPEGEEVMPPTVFPKPGLTFIGWRYAGTGDPDIADGTPIYLDANGTKNNSVILYAEYVDSEGNAYCACGNLGERLFDGASWQGMNTRSFFVTFAPLAIASAVVFGVLLAKGGQARFADGDKDAKKGRLASDAPVANGDDSQADGEDEADGPDVDGGADAE